jgi:hypothetical protein
LVDALIENVEESLARRPVKIGADGVPTYVYRAEAANTAIKMAASEVGLFQDKSDVRAKLDFEELSDEELLANALLLEHEAKMVDVTPEDG